MIKFGDSAIENCNFTNVNIECYEPQTCKSVISENNKYLMMNFRRNINYVPKKKSMKF